MKNRNVGLIILGVAFLILFIILSYNRALESIVNVSCSHGTACPMYATINTQRDISYALTSFLIIGGLYLVFFSRDKKTMIKQSLKSNLGRLDDKEKRIVEILNLNNGSSYQSDFIKDTGWSKVKITRILDKLEGKNVIERKRRGMTNIVILK